MKCKAYAQRVFCYNYSKCLSFYKDTIGLPLKLGNEDTGWAEFDVGGLSLAIEKLDINDQESNALVGRFIGLSLEVDDLSMVYEELKSKGVEFTSAPKQQSWGGALAHFKDPAGNILTLLQSGNA